MVSDENATPSLLTETENVYKDVRSALGLAGAEHCTKLGLKYVKFVRMEPKRQVAPVPAMKFEPEIWMTLGQPRGSS